MFRIPCPHCGLRDQIEFAYGREAAPLPPLDGPVAAWQAYVYDRANPCGPHDEWWHHTYGCQQWIRVQRDTLTHAVLAVTAAPGS